MMQMHYFHEISRQVASIRPASEKAHSRKPISIHSHAYAVAGCMRAGLFIELPRRGLLGNLDNSLDLSDQPSVCPG